jgi:hypothetical protein
MKGLYLQPSIDSRVSIWDGHVGRLSSHSGTKAIDNSKNKTTLVNRVIWPFSNYPTIRRYP